MQEFSPQLGQHHPFGLGHETVAHHSTHRSATTSAPSRPSHTPTATFMHETVGYGGLNGQSLGYNVHVSADKNLVLPGLASHAGLAGHGLGTPGNLQPGYLPRPVETSSPNCDSELAPSTGIHPSFHFLLSLPLLPILTHFLVVAGYPGKRVTGPPSHHLLLTSERVQDAMVTSTEHRRQEMVSTPNDHRLLLLPSAAGGGQHHQPQQSTFLGCDSTFLLFASDMKGAGNNLPFFSL